MALARKNIDLTNAALQKSTQSYNIFGRAVAGTGLAVDKATLDIKNNTLSLTANAKAAEENVGIMQRFGEQIGLAFRRFGAFIVSASAISAVIFQFREAVVQASNFNDTLIKLSQVTKSSTQGEGIQKISSEVSRISKTFGVSSKELLSVSNTLAQAGLTSKETATALEALAKTRLSASFGDIKDTTEGAIAAMSQFGFQARDLEKALSSVGAVSAAFAVESSDLIDLIKRTGGAFKAAAGDVGSSFDQFNQMLALFTSVRATTRESAETISTGFRSIFARLQRPETIEDLKNLGIELSDLDGKFVGPFEAVRRLSEAVRTLGLDTRDVRFAGLVEELGGIRQVSRVIPLLQQFPTAIRAYAVAQSSANTISEDAARQQEAVGVRIVKLQEQFLELARVVGSSTAFKGFISLIETMTSAILSLGKALDVVIPALTGLALFAGIKGIGNAFQGVKKVIGSKNAPSPSITGFNQGGRVGGGYGGGDKIPAYLEEGEFVVRKEAASAIGHGTLNQMNMNPRRYERGGTVVGFTPEEFKKYYFGGDRSPEANEKRLLRREGAIRKYLDTVGKQHGIELDQANVIYADRGISSRLHSNSRYAGVQDDVRSSFKKHGIETAGAYYPTSNSSYLNLHPMEDVTTSFRSTVAHEAVHGLDEKLGDYSRTPRFSDLNKQIGKFYENSLGFFTLQSERRDPYRFKPQEKFADIFSKYLINDLTDFREGENKYGLNEKIDEAGLENIKKGIKQQTLPFIRDTAPYTGSTYKNFLSEISEKYGKNQKFKGVLDTILRGRRLASGGRIGQGYGGGDKVPAMLEEGEFVVRKEAASKIGYGNLQAYNSGSHKNMASGTQLTYEELLKLRGSGSGGVGGMSEILRTVNAEIRKVLIDSFRKAGDTWNEAQSKAAEAMRSQALNYSTRILVGKGNKVTGIPADQIRALQGYRVDNDPNAPLPTLSPLRKKYLEMFNPEQLSLYNTTPKTKTVPLSSLIEGKSKEEIAKVFGTLSRSLIPAFQEASTNGLTLSKSLEYANTATKKFFAFPSSAEVNIDKKTGLPVGFTQKFAESAKQVFFSDSDKNDKGRTGEEAMRIRIREEEQRQAKLAREQELKRLGLPVRNFSIPEKSLLETAKSPLRKDVESQIGEKLSALGFNGQYNAALASTIASSQVKSGSLRLGKDGKITSLSDPTADFAANKGKSDINDEIERAKQRNAKVFVVQAQIEDARRVRAAKLAGDDSTLRGTRLGQLSPEDRERLVGQTAKELSRRGFTPDQIRNFAPSTANELLRKVPGRAGLGFNSQSGNFSVIGDNPFFGSALNAAINKPQTLDEALNRRIQTQDAKAAQKRAVDSAARDKALQEQAAQEAKERRANIAGRVGLGAAVGGGVVASLIPKSNSFLAGTSGALGAGSLAASLGLLVSGPFALIAGLGAAAVGAVAGVKDFNESLKTADVEKFSESLQTATQRFAQTGVFSSDLKSTLAGTNKAVGEQVSTRQTQGIFSSLFTSKDDFLKQANRDISREVLGPIRAEVFQLDQAITNTSSSIEDYKKANDGAGKAVLNLLAQMEAAAKNISLGSATAIVERRKAEDIQTIQRARNINISLLRMGESSQKAADSLLALTTILDKAAIKTSTLTEVNSVIGGGRASGVEFSSLFTKANEVTNTDFFRQLKVVVQPFGDAGKAIQDQATNLRNLSTQLPDILTELQHGSGINVIQDFDKRIAAISKDQSLNKTLGTQFRAILRGGQGIESAGIIKNLQEKDVNDVSRTLLEKSAGTLGGVLENLAENIKKKNVVLIELLQQRAEVEEKITESLGNVGDTQGAFFRVQAEFKGRTTGRSPLDFITNEQANFGFNNRLRLLGQEGRSPSDIAEEIKKTNAQISNFGPVGGREAAESLRKLQDKARDLTKALELMAKSTEKVSILQERLSKIQADRDNRRSIGAAILGGSPDEISELNRKAEAARQVLEVTQRGGNAFNLPDQIRQLGVQALQNEFKNIKFGALGTGQEVVDKNVARLGAFQGIDFGIGANNEQKQIFGEIAQEFRNQIEAQNAQTEVLKGIKDLTVDNFNKAVKEFDSAVKLFDLNFQKGNLERQRGDIAPANRAIENLRGAGFNPEQAADIFNKNKGKFINLRDLDEAEEKLKKAFNFKDFKEASKALTGGAATDKNAFVDVARSKGIDAKLAEEAFDRAVKRTEASDAADRAAGRFAKNGLRDAGQPDFRVLANEFFGLFKTQVQDIDNQRNDIAKRIQQPLGGDALDVNQIIKLGKQLPDLRALEGQKVEEVTKKFAELSIEIDALKDKISEVNGNRQFNLMNPDFGGPNPNVPKRFAAGGFAFKPRGSDTVPAMLTPGEYIVNAKAASKNRALLEKINSGEGMYAADGGSVRKKGRRYIKDENGDLILADGSPEELRQSVLDAQRAFAARGYVSVDRARAEKNARIQQELQDKATLAGFKPQSNGATSFERRFTDRGGLIGGASDKPFYGNNANGGTLQGGGGGGLANPGLGLGRQFARVNIGADKVMDAVKKTRIQQQIQDRVDAQDAADDAIRAKNKAKIARGEKIDPNLGIAVPDVNDLGGPAARRETANALKLAKGDVFRDKKDLNYVSDRINKLQNKREVSGLTEKEFKELNALNSKQADLGDSVGLSSGFISRNSQQQDFGFGLQRNPFAGGLVATVDERAARLRGANPGGQNNNPLPINDNANPNKLAGAEGPFADPRNLGGVKQNGQVATADFIAAVNKFDAAVNNKAFIEALNNFPRQIKLEGPNNMVVEVKGLDALKVADAAIKQAVAEAVDKKMKEMAPGRN